MDEKDAIRIFTEAQNSTVESQETLSFTNDPLRENISAPARVSVTPHNSLLKLEKKKEQEIEKLLWWKNETATLLPIKELKSGICVKNALQNRLYEYTNQKV